jgi:hypothetical protein
LLSHAAICLTWQSATPLRNENRGYLHKFKQFIFGPNAASGLPATGRAGPSKEFNP